MKVCIFGAGAVGGHLAARLADAGLDVSVIARGAHLAAIRAQGLRFIGHDKEIVAQVRASERPEELGPQDLVITAVKAHSLPEMASLLPPLLNVDTPVIYALNGIPWWYFHTVRGDADKHLTQLDPGCALQRSIGAHRAIGCVIRSPNEVLAPGVVRSNSANNSFALGEPDGSISSRLGMIEKALKPGLPGVFATSHIREEIWRKLLSNMSYSPVSVLALASNQDIARSSELTALCRHLVVEGLAVARAHGVDIDSDLYTGEQLIPPVAHRPSMLQDLLAGRSLEIDAQLGAVQELGRMANVATPFLDAMTALVRQRIAFSDGLASGA